MKWQKYAWTGINRNRSAQVELGIARLPRLPPLGTFLPRLAAYDVGLAHGVLFYRTIYIRPAGPMARRLTSNQEIAGSIPASAGWPNGKALDYESRDCRFDPCVGHFLFIYST
ncbi:hypothetical protein N7530_003139 [Penicillium desertorum]|uniref:Uncharacterized protein n=1 Tax=Penicillium desertorum TaxID=1303715 RepID=A0A9W9WVQ9_9EURO|nr:hypothetical protein N7530_003139 [Penicillium desertorum]